MNDQLIGPNDLLIAAIVKFHEGVLTTNSTEEFNRVEGLKMENWVQGY
jgi:tRNA(fMet)-specific endonuclease VapC